MKKVFWGVLGLAMLSGCGILKPAKNEEITSSGGAAKASPNANSNASLNLRIVRAGDADANLPDRAFDLSAPQVGDQVTDEGGLITFGNKIDLPDHKNPRKLFLVCPEDWMGTKIQSGSVQRRVLDEHGQPSTGVTNVPFNLDPGARRWYVAFSDLFPTGSPESNPDPDRQQQQLVLNIILADHSSKQLEVRMRVAGAAPGLEVKEQVQNVISDFTAETRGGLHKAVIVRTAQVSNPAQCPLQLRFRADPGEAIEFDTYLSQQKHDYYGPVSHGNHYEGVQALPVRSWSVSTVGLSVSWVKVSFSGQDQAKFVKLSPFQWSKLEFGAGLTASIQWLAVPTDSSGGCPLPSVLMNSITWFPPPTSDCLRVNSAIDVSCQPHSDSVDETWKIRRQSAGGTWRQGFSVQNAWNDLPEDGELSERTLQFQSGEDAGILPVDGPFACQGLF